MKEYTIELFLPLFTDVFEPSEIERYTSHPAIKDVWLLSGTDGFDGLPANVHVLKTASLTETSLFVEMATRATADFVL